MSFDFSMTANLFEIVRRAAMKSCQANEPRARVEWTHRIPYY